MKKSLLALAVLGAFAGAASAQTSVTIYGLIDSSIQFRDQDGTGAATSGDTWSLSSGQMSGTRIGFRGTEDLGGGLSAIFTLENGFTNDDGQDGQSDRLFGRQAWVGLQGSFGAVRLGRQQTVSWAASGAVDPFGAANSHGSQRIFGAGGYNTDPFLRADNTISYTSPNVSGLTATVAYSFGETADAFAAGRTYQAGVSYVNGPINGQFAYLKTRAPAGSSLTISGFSSTEIRTALIGGSYDLGVVKPFVAYVDSKGENATDSQKVRNYLLGISAPVGAAGTALASWIRNDNRDVDDGEQDQFSIGYVHNLSKRTNLYTAFSLNKADANGAVQSISVADQDTKLFSVGVRHSF